MAGLRVKPITASQLRPPGLSGAAERREAQVTSCHHDPSGFDEDVRLLEEEQRRFVIKSCLLLSQILSHCQSR